MYFTDSRRPWLYRLPLGHHGELPDASDVQTIPLSGDYVHDPTVGVNNLNGIVATPNGKMLIAVQSNTASLLRIDPGTGVADTIELTGGDATNGDGLLLVGRTLYVVQNFRNQVAVIHLALRPRLGYGRRPPVTFGVQSADDDRQGERALVPAERSLRGAQPGYAGLRGRQPRLAVELPYGTQGSLAVTPFAVENVRWVRRRLQSPRETDVHVVLVSRVGNDHSRRPVQAGPVADEHHRRAGVEEAVEEILREPAIHRFG